MPGQAGGGGVLNKPHWRRAGQVSRVLRSSCCDWKSTGNWTGL
jgi:hypothetical protein